MITFYSFFCVNSKEWNYKAIIRLNEIIGWKYEKKWKSFHLAVKN